MKDVGGGGVVFITCRNSRPLTFHGCVRKHDSAYTRGGGCDRNSTVGVQKEVCGSNDQGRKIMGPGQRYTQLQGAQFSAGKSHVILSGGFPQESQYAFMHQHVPKDQCPCSKLLVL